MKLSPTLILTAALLGLSAPAAMANTPADSTSVETSTKLVRVFGLNCGPCGEEMRKRMQEMAGATDLHANLECGKVWVDMPRTRELNEGALTGILLTKGYTLKGVGDSTLTAKQAREQGEAACKN